ncbi:hypothetical protein GOV07_02505 [Candidatus Woesearchaeota archaeon]|nr:hypothetical protein [Candidatus Woesearchaeota archaeon]
MKKTISISFIVLMLLSMVSATYVSEGQTQEVVSGQTEPDYVGTAVQATDVKPSIAANGAFSGTLREGQTTYHYWNGEKYEITLVWVSDAQYWEDDREYKGIATDAERAPSLDNRPSAKFSINGELTNALYPGEKDETRSGTIKVKEIGNSVTERGDQGSASYTFYPSYEPPIIGKYKIYEGQTQTVTVSGHRFSVGVKEIHDEVAVMTVNGQAEKVQEHVTAKINGLQFNPRAIKDGNDNPYLENNYADIAYERGYVIIKDLKVVSTPSPSDAIKGRLYEGQTQTYRWNGQSYELTLIYVSDPVYWEEGNTITDEAAAASISNRPVAKFMLNGQVTDAIPVGGSDKVRCGKIQVTRIEATTGSGDQYWGLDETKTEVNSEYGYADADMAQAVASGVPTYVGPPESERRDIAYFTLWPTSCSSVVPPRACTEDAKICPDGSYVSRDPARNCAFDPCPSDYDERKEKCYASGGQWECQAYAEDSTNPYGNSDTEYQGDNNCRCRYQPTPQPYNSADECQERGGQWVCSENYVGSDNQYGIEPGYYGDEGNCRCIEEIMPYPDPYNPCYEGCADGDDCGCDDQVQWDEELTCSSGCAKDGRCLPYGTRLANGEAVFCSIEGEFSTQKTDGASCQNNYECVSNQCLNAECKSLDKELRETQNLIQKLFDWFGNIF